MSTCYNRLILLVVVLMGLGRAAALSGLRTFISPNEHPNPFFFAEDAETVFALGLRQPLGCMTQFDLELIPGISSEAANRITERRSNIIALARGSSPTKALQSVFGIGEVTAAKLQRYIDVNQSCSLTVSSPKNES